MNVHPIIFMIHLVQIHLFRRRNVETNIGESIKESVKENLQKFLIKYNANRDSLKEASEQTMRSWIDEFLSIFDWDCQNLHQVHQEKAVSKEEREKLKSIGSSHTTPDYTLKNGSVRINFLDAKDLQDNLKDDGAIAFQARSYGWSAGLECTVVTNIEELAFYSCLKQPNEQDNPNLDRIYFKFDQYIENFDEIFKLLYRPNVISGLQAEMLNSGISNRKDNMVELDQSFANLLSNFRLALAGQILKHKKDLNSGNELNHIVQSIINKIMFVRFCEGRGLEEENLLLKLTEDNFWNSFKQTLTRYEINYDGPMFCDLKDLEDLLLEDEVFLPFIKQLYYPSPYKFDVIPIELLAEVYEKFLSQEIIIEHGAIKHRQKEFYVKQQGAISTPKFMVDFLLERVFNGFKHVNTLDDLFKVKILDPACGSGTFLLGILEALETKAVELFMAGQVNIKQYELFVKLDNVIYPTVELRRQLILNCIYAIDMDIQAVEVAKMSLALRLIDNFSRPDYNEELGLCRDLLLNQIGKNIIHGNTLVGFDILEDFENIGSELEVLKTLVPLNVTEDFSEVFGRETTDKSGFDYIVGNPPYVETKSYIDGLPYCRDYFKIHYDMDDQKADMSIYFIEKCIKMLNSHGKLAFLCQRRFFKTEYGAKTRRYLSKNNAIETIVEFEASDIFKGRTTYVAMLVISKQSTLTEEFNYARIIGNCLVLKNTIADLKDQKFMLKDTNILTQNTWNFTDNNDLQQLVGKLTKEFSSLDSLEQMGICGIHGGIQVLRNDVYYINEATRQASLISGINRRQDSDPGFRNVTVEEAVCRPIVANKNFKKFQTIQPTYYAIVPYTLDGTEPINFDDMQEEFPLCADYLLRHKQYISENNKEMEEGNNWNLFTRTTNLKQFNIKKILFPMTNKEIVAAYAPEPVYPDNANMWGLTFKDEDDDFHLAITALLNSKLFSVLAIYFSNPQANGYRKMNKQFVNQVPIPYDKIKEDSSIIQTLAGHAKTLNKLQNELDKAGIEGEERILTALIQKNTGHLNRFVYDLYELGAFERAVIEDSYDVYMAL